LHQGNLNFSFGIVFGSIETSHGFDLTDSSNAGLITVYQPENGLPQETFSTGKRISCGDCRIDLRSISAGQVLRSSADVLL
jgi:hypothetical protein